MARSAATVHILFIDSLILFPPTTYCTLPIYVVT
jgi:hypothetical protein